MSQAEHLATLIRELERVGVDPNTFSAGLAVRDEDLLQILRTLPDAAGPSALLARLRLHTHPGAR
jgi:hypothetical protein